MWLSLVERCLREADVAGSNPVTPILINGLRGDILTSGFWSATGVQRKGFSVLDSGLNLRTFVLNLFIPKHFVTKTFMPYTFQLKG